MIRFRVLGPLSVLGPGGEVQPLSSAMQRRLLAVLLSRPDRPVSVDLITDQLWPGPPPRTARKAVQVYVHQLRRLLGDADRIRHQDGRYRLAAAAEELDSLVFEAAVRGARSAQEAGRSAAALAGWEGALALWHGTEAFADLEDSSLVLAERRRLAELRLEALTGWAASALALGRHHELTVALPALLAEHPYQERLHALHLLALYRDGRQAEALAAYRALHERLVTDLGVEPTPELRRLHGRMLRQDRTLETPSAAGPRPVRQLPRAVPGFVGCTVELARLDELAGTVGNTVVITAVAGAAGIGKTSLAVHWSHLAAERFPDGQLYLDLHGFGPSGTALAPEEALRALLEALGTPPEQMPRGLQARAARYRDLLAGRRMLIVLDNARDSEQVRPLLPGSPRCFTLVTSRNGLTGLVAGAGAHPLLLPFMEAEEARRLLSSRLGSARLDQDPAATAAVIAHCGGLPLALAVLAARAALRAEPGLGPLAAELAATAGSLRAFAVPEDRSTDVQAVFTWSYRALSPSAARLFRLLGLHPGPDLSAAAAASLAGHPVAAELAELVETHLLLSPAPGRYALHDLLRSFAAELTDGADGSRPGAEEEGRAAALRMLDHHVQTAQAADRLLAPTRDPVVLPAPLPGVRPETVEDPLAWFATEHQVLLALTAYAEAAGLPTAVGQLAWALGTYLNRQGHWHDWVSVQGAALEAHRRLGDLRGQAVTGMNLARARTRLGHFDLAEPEYLRARDRFHALDDAVGLGHVHLNLGWMCDQQGDRHPEALAFAELAAGHYRTAGHEVGRANALNAAGWYHSQLGDHAGAVARCTEALTLQERIGDRRAQANTWDSLGYAHHHLADHAEAVRCYRRAVEIQEEVGERYQIADTLVHLADTLAALDRTEELRAALEQALTICQELDHPDRTAIATRLAGLAPLSP
ncbi:AfsR/SARP family transcriptional regulator [Kitasatospora albolonga]|uniref:AfsR/SARP family transcriptional regulator n=1 Tax=Kitasatospora albolonga TaxID=68173 RepID=UPI0031F17ED7